MDIEGHVYGVPNGGTGRGKFLLAETLRASGWDVRERKTRYGIEFDILTETGCTVGNINNNYATSYSDRDLTDFFDKYNGKRIEIKKPNKKRVKSALQ